MTFKQVNKLSERRVFVSFLAKSISLSSGFVLRYNPKEYVEIFYDDDSNKVGFMFTNEKTINSWKISLINPYAIQKKITCTFLLKHTHKRIRGRFFDINENDDGMIIVDLNGEKEIPKAGRSRNKGGNYDK